MSKARIDLYRTDALKKLRKGLEEKYSSGEFSYDIIQTNYLVFNEKCRVVAIFKDYLIYDDLTEFCRRFYNKGELKQRLSKIFNFYETYSKIFPNYMILPESEYLYKNIRKKQKMIDAFNQIKREEEENRKNLNIGPGKKSSNSLNKISNRVFDDSIQNSINKYQPSLMTCNDVDNSMNSISISLLSKKNIFINPSQSTRNKYQTPSSSFVFEDSLSSIAMIVQNFPGDVPPPIETPKRKKPSADIIEQKREEDHHIQSALNNNRKFISHKAAVSVPEINNNSIKIINNYHNIIIPEGINTVININNNYFNVNGPHENSDPHKPQIKTVETGSSTESNTHNKKGSKPKEKKKNFSLNKNTTNATNNQRYNGPKEKSSKKKTSYSNRRSEMSNSSTAFKSPEKSIGPTLSLSKKKDAPTTIVTTTHVMPIYKNKNLYKIKTLSALQNKINPFKKKFEKKKNLDIKKDIISSFTNANVTNVSTAKKDIKVTVITEGDIATQKETIGDCHEMKTKYKNFIEKSKIDGLSSRKSYDTEHRKLLTIQGQSKSKNGKNSIEGVNNTYTNNSTRKTNLKSPLPNKNILSPKGGAIKTSEVKFPLTTKIKLTQKSPLRKDGIQSFVNASKIIKNINFKVVDTNTKKMKFVKK